jgi:hypothetical protein
MTVAPPIFATGDASSRGSEIACDDLDFRPDRLKKTERTAFYEMSLNHRADLRNRFVKRLTLSLSGRAQAIQKTGRLPLSASA